MKENSIIPKIRQETRIVKMTYEIKKDLQEDEVICPTCHGTGLNIQDNVYGIRGDATHVGVHFPYNNQSLGFCRQCFNGVLHKCPGCGALRGRDAHKDCPCGYQSRKRHEKLAQEEQKRWESAEKISVTEAFERFGALYIDNCDRYVFDEGDLECAIDDYKDDIGNDADISNLRIYGTHEEKLSLDADSIVSGACEDLHEDAYEQCSDIDELQKVLDNWCDNQTGTTTYSPDWSTGIVRVVNR